MNCKICGLSDQARTELETLVNAKVPYSQIVDTMAERYKVAIGKANITNHKAHMESNRRNSDPEPKVSADTVDISGMAEPVAIEIVNNALKRILKLEDLRGFLTPQERAERDRLLDLQLKLTPDKARISDGTTYVEWQEAIAGILAASRKDAGHIIQTEDGVYYKVKDDGTLEYLNADKDNGHESYTPRTQGL